MIKLNDENYKNVRSMIIVELVSFLSMHFFSERLKTRQVMGLTKNEEKDFCCRFCFEFLRLMFPFKYFK